MIWLECIFLIILIKNGFELVNITSGLILKGTMYLMFYLLQLQKL